MHALTIFSHVPETHSVISSDQSVIVNDALSRKKKPTPSWKGSRPRAFPSLPMLCSRRLWCQSIDQLNCVNYTPKNQERDSWMTLGMGPIRRAVVPPRRRARRTTRKSSSLVEK